MKNFTKKIFNQRTFSFAVFVTFILSAIFVTLSLVLAPTIETATPNHARIKSDYILMLSQCVFGIIAMLLPGLVEKRFNISIPSKMIIFYALFLFCAIYLGEVRSFYYTVPHWDTILHTVSGCILGALGFSLVTILNKTDRIPLNISPIFVSLFAFCFAVALGVVWEIYEFSADAIMSTNMQKYAAEGGVNFIGRAALDDTMKDLIVDCIGAFAISVFGYISLKYKKNWLEQLRLKQRSEPNSIDN